MSGEIRGQSNRCREIPERRWKRVRKERRSGPVAGRVD